MKPALRYQHHRAPMSWRDIAHGEQIQQALDGYLALWWPKLFGYHLLKIGNLSCELDSSHCQIKHQVGVAESSPIAGVKADIDELPFGQHSVDVTVLSHCLEFCPDPHHLVREAHRVLIPDGHIIITGFNPYSFCGIVKPFYRSDRFPWCGRFFTPARISDWLDLMGFEVLADHRLLHSSFSRKKSLSHYRLWHHFCQDHLGRFGSIYVIVAKKRSLPLTPIKPKWHAKPHFNPATVKSAIRQ